MSDFKIPVALLPFIAGLVVGGPLPQAVESSLSSSASSAFTTAPTVTPTLTGAAESSLKPTSVGGEGSITSAPVDGSLTSAGFAQPTTGAEVFLSSLSVICSSFESHASSASGSFGAPTSALPTATGADASVIASATACPTSVTVTGTAATSAALSTLCSLMLSASTTAVPGVPTSIGESSLVPGVPTSVVETSVAPTGALTSATPAVPTSLSSALTSDASSALTSAATSALTSAPIQKRQTATGAASFATGSASAVLSSATSGLAATGTGVAAVTSMGGSGNSALPSGSIPSGSIPSGAKSWTGSHTWSGMGPHGGFPFGSGSGTVFPASKTGTAIVTARQETTSSTAAPAMVTVPLVTSVNGVLTTILTVVPSINTSTLSLSTTAGTAPSSSVSV